MEKKDLTIDEIIAKVTEQVAARLKQAGVSMDKGGRDGMCVADKDSCTSCGQCASKKSGTVNKIIDLGAARISSNFGVGAKGIDTELASMIDHTILKPDATKDDLTKICNEAKQYNFATVCVNSVNIPLVARLLRGSQVKPIAVVGFPLGAASTNAKVCEAREAVSAGAKEIDMVVNIGALKSKDYRTVYEDIKAVVDVSRPYIVKVILETSSLDHNEKVAACVLSKSAGAAFVKTSTGFGSGGATVEDIALMRKVVGSDMEVKASGGIRTKEDAEAMVAAGADRIGASASVAIVTGAASKKGAAGKY